MDSIAFLIAFYQTIHFVRFLIMMCLLSFATHVRTLVRRSSLRRAKAEGVGCGHESLGLFLHCARKRPSALDPGSPAPLFERGKGSCVMNH